MRRLKYGFALLFALFLIFGSSLAAFADNPHFITEGTDSINSSGALVATGFKEAGLGSTTTTEKITLTASAIATYACINGGGKHPSASNKETVSGPVTGTGTFPVRNGQTTGGSISAGPPSAGSFTCPSGQKLVLAFVSYTSVLLTGLAGDTSSLPDISACLFPGVGIC